MMKALAAAAVFLCLAQPIAAQGPGPSNAGAPSKGGAVKILMTIGAATVEATLLDTPTARDFLALLPVTVALEDYAATEKIAYLPRKLSTTGAPEGSTPSAGDIAYYAPWGNLAIFYRDFEYSPGLIRLGRIESGLEALKAAGPQKVTIRVLGQ